MAGPKVKYDDYVDLEQIKQLAATGMIQRDIAKSIGMSESGFYRYIKMYPEIKAAIVEGRQTVVSDIKTAMLQKALGYTYTETKTTVRKSDDGETTVTETWEKYAAPSESAAAMLLRQYDKDYIDRDQTSMDLRKQELQLKTAVAEANNFDLNVTERNNDD